MIAVAALAVLTIVVVIAFNTFGGDTRDVQVPDVRGQVSADAIAALQNHGFKTRTLQKPDSTDPARPRHRHRPGRQRVGRAPATRSRSTSRPGPSSARCPMSPR